MPSARAAPSVTPDAAAADARSGRPRGPRRAPVRPLSAYAWMSASALLFASMNVLARVVGPGVHFTTFAATRAAVGAAVAYGAARARGVSPWPTSARSAWPRSVFGTISMGLTFYALVHRDLPLGDTVTLLGLNPVFVALLAPVVLGERATPRTLAALTQSVIGVTLVLRPSFLFGGASLGALGKTTTFVALAAALSSAFAMMMLRRASERDAPEAVAVHFSVVATVALAIAGIGHHTLPSARDAAWMLAAGVTAGLGQLAMTRAYALDGAARVGAMGHLAVVASWLGGVLVLGDPARAHAAAGGALVVAAGLVVGLEARSARRRTERPST